MRSVNRVTLMGNLGHAPELQRGKTGRFYTRLRIATDKRYQKEDGEWDSKSEWHSVFVFGKTAEICAEHMRKGANVYVEGHLTYWKEDEGNVHKSSITADTVNFWNNNRAVNAAPDMENLDNPESARNHDAVAHPA